MIDMALTGTMSGMFAKYSKTKDDSVILLHSKGLRLGIEMEVTKASVLKTAIENLITYEA